MRNAATGIILAGGASRRMGQDKSALQLGDGLLLEHVVAPLSRLCPEVVVAAGSRPHQRLSGVSPVWVADPPGATGPLAGLAAGLAAASHPTAIVVACDMPFLSENLLEHLLDLVQDCDAAVPLVGGLAQPIHAAYARGCLPAVESLLRLGARSMRDLLPRLRVKYLSEQRCAELDPEGLSCFNMNTVDDLRLARNYWTLRQARVVAA
jgi:molybdopterin-guanine dinucleotide biosynthesis protein A